MQFYPQYPQYQPYYYPQYLQYQQYVQYPQYPQYQQYQYQQYPQYHQYVQYQAVMPSYPMPEEIEVKDGTEVPVKVHHQTSQLLTRANQLLTILKNGYYYNIDQITSQARMKLFIPLVGIASYGCWKILNNFRNGKIFYNQDIGRLFNNFLHHYGREMVVVSLISMVVTLASAYFVKKAIDNLNELYKEKAYLKEARADWKKNKAYYDTAYQATVDQIAVKTEIVLDRLITDKIHQIALIIFGFIAQGTLLAGTLIASKVLLMTGILLGAAVGITGIFKLYHYYVNNPNKEYEQEIEQKLHKLTCRD